MDLTRGHNKYKFCLSTVMVVDENNPANPVVFFIHSSQSEDVLTNFFDTLAQDLGPASPPPVSIETKSRLLPSTDSPPLICPFAAGQASAAARPAADPLGAP